MFAIKTESIKSYVEAPKSLLKEHRNLIALIADNGNHFLAYGIVEGTTLYIDLDAEYEENTQTTIPTGLVVPGSLRWRTDANSRLTV